MSLKSVSRTLLLVVTSSAFAADKPNAGDNPKLDRPVKNLVTFYAMGDVPYAPVFIIPGDNEWNNRTNPVEA